MFIKGSLSVGETAEYLGLSQSAVYRLVRKKELAATKSGRRFQIQMTEVERWLDEATRPSAVSA